MCVWTTSIMSSLGPPNAGLNAIFSVNCPRRGDKKSILAFGAKRSTDKSPSSFGPNKLWLLYFFSSKRERRQRETSVR